MVCAHPSLGCAGFIRPCAALLLSQREDGKSQLIYLGQQMQKEPLLFTQILSIVFLHEVQLGRAGICLLEVCRQAGVCFSQGQWQVYDTGDHDILVIANRDAQTRDINSNYKIFH